ncbi:MAG: hypothetical protein ABR526_13575 [Chthoniobacterales bacterium]
MKRHGPILIAGLALFSAVAIVVLITPLIVANGLRTWVWYHARQQGLAVAIGAIDAPLFRPVVLRDIHAHGSATSGFEWTLEVSRVEFGVDLRAIAARSDRRWIRDLSVDGARLAVRKIAEHAGLEQRSPRSSFQQLFADTFRISHFDLRWQEGNTTIEMHDASLSASEVETGSLAIREVAVASPLISKRFTELRGATTWQNERLTLGAITLTRGIDIDAITADFSHVASHRIGFELNSDVFGGKVRGNVMEENRNGRQLWDVAATASEISLAQMSAMLGWQQPATGAIRTCKFTFRGDASDPLEATTSIWAEVNDFTFGDRTAETIMLGGSIYNRRVHLEQLYVKQQTNQFTLSGDSPLPFRSEDPAHREVNGDLFANIGDLDAFARLFGAGPGEYSGQLVVDGTMVFAERKARAALTATGEVQLLDARFPNAARVSADISCNGGNATIRYADISSAAADVGIWGEIAFTDLREVEAKLFPTAPLVDATKVPSGSCVRGLALAAPAGADSNQPQITQIAIKGGLSQADWNVSLQTRGAENIDVARTFRICPATASADELRVVATASAGP